MKIFKILGFGIFVILASITFNRLMLKSGVKNSCSQIMLELAENKVIQTGYKFSHSLIEKNNPFFSNYVPLTNVFEKNVNIVCYAKSAQPGRLELRFGGYDDLTLKRLEKYSEYQNEKMILISVYRLEPSESLDNSSMNLNIIWSLNNMEFPEE